jgi:hypothetical protein
MVELDPPLNLTAKIHPYSTHGLDLARGVPHLTREKSHDTTWNYPCMPHPHGIHALSNRGWTPNTWISTRRHQMHHPLSSHLLESQSFQFLELPLRTSAFGIWPMYQHVKSPRALKSRSFKVSDF